MSTKLVLALTLGMSASAAPQMQTTWYVADDGDPGNGCTSWADACPELQTALSLATAGDHIWVAEGTYKPDYDVDTEQHTGDREASFELNNGLAIYGGFDGTESTLEERAGLFDQTVLTGDLLGDDVGPPGDPSSAENSYHVVTGEGLNNTTRLDGFLITAGNADADGIPHDAGGGMRLELSSPAIANITFYRNAAGYGGGLENFVAGSPTLTHCAFVENLATFRGGGMHNNDSRPTLTDCSFIENTAFNSGGGMRNWHDSEPILKRCSFVNNAAGFGGGMVNDESHPRLSDCTFDGNFAEGTSGGMHNWISNPTLRRCVFNDNFAATAGGGMYNINASSPTAADCMFTGNVAETASGGGVRSIRESTPTFLRCTFYHNSAGFGGGGMSNDDSNAVVSHCIFGTNEARFGGGMWNDNGSDSVVTNSLFTGNVAVVNGGAMDNNASAPQVTNSTFSANQAIEDSAGGIWNVNNSSAWLSNCVLWGNSDSGGDDESAQIDGSSGSLPDVFYSCVQGLTGNLGGIGNIGEDPLFEDALGLDGVPGTQDDDLRLDWASPCIDAADNTAVPVGVVTDLAGYPRFVDDPNTDDSGFGDPPIVDMGSYEYQDLCEDDDGDGRVTICHIPPGNFGNPRTITVSVNAVPAHLRHGDYCGVCD